MGVNWQRGELYTALKNQERTGLSLSEQNTQANPCGNPSFGGLLLSQCLPQLLSGGMEFLAGKVGGGSSKKVAEKVEEETVDPKSLKKDIQTVLDKYKNQGITSVEDLEAYLQIKYDETNSNIESLESSIPENEAKREELTARNTEISTRLGEIDTLLGNGNGSIASQLKELDEQISAYEAEGINTTELKAKKLELMQQQQKLPEEKQKLEKEQSDNINTLTPLIGTIAVQNLNLKTFKEIQADIEEIKEKQLNLDKAEGKESASTLVNASTKNITDLIKQYNQAQMDGDSNKKSDLETKLKTALQEYVNNPENKNITIKNYAEQYFQIKSK